MLSGRRAVRVGNGRTMETANGEDLEKSQMQFQQVAGSPNAYLSLSLVISLHIVFISPRRLIPF